MVEVRMVKKYGAVKPLMEEVSSKHIIKNTFRYNICNIYFLLLVFSYINNRVFAARDLSFGLILTV